MPKDENNDNKSGSDSKKEPTKGKKSDEQLSSSNKREKKSNSPKESNNSSSQSDNKMNQKAGNEQNDKEAETSGNNKPEETEEKKTSMEDIESGKAEKIFTEKMAKPGDELDDVTRGKFFAVISYIPIMCIFTLVFKRKNKFAIFHAKQGALLLAWHLSAMIIRCFFYRIWLVGKVLGPIGCFIWGVSMFFIFILSAIGIYQAFSGNYWRLPVMLGDWAEDIEVPQSGEPTSNIPK